MRPDFISLICVSIFVEEARELLACHGTNSVVD